MGCVDKTVVVSEALQLSSVDMAVTSVSRCVVVVVVVVVLLLLLLLLWCCCYSRRTPCSQPLSLPL